MEELVSFIKKNINTTVCFASYHTRDGLPTYKIIEDRYKNLSDIIVKTVYPYHTTTYVVNRKSTVAKKLINLPSYEEMNKLIWKK